MAPETVNIRRAWMLLVLLMAAVWFGNLEYRKLVRRTKAATQKSPVKWPPAATGLRRA